MAAARGAFAADIDSRIRRPTSRNRIRPSAINLIGGRLPGPSISAAWPSVNVVSVIPCVIAARQPVTSGDNSSVAPPDFERLDPAVTYERLEFELWDPNVPPDFDERDPPFGDEPAGEPLRRPETLGGLSDRKQLVHVDSDQIVIAGAVGNATSERLRFTSDATATLVAE